MSTRFLKFVQLLTLTLLLCSCGFKPLYINYGEDEIVSELEKIEVMKGKGRLGANLSNYIFDQLNPMDKRVKDYKLSFTYKTTETSVLVQNNSEITRYNLLVNVDYYLDLHEEGNRVTSGTVAMWGSYDSMPTSYYSTEVSKDATLDNIAKEVAKEIRRKLIIYFLNRRYENS